MDIGMEGTFQIALEASDRGFANYGFQIRQDCIQCRHWNYTTYAEETLTSANVHTPQLDNGISSLAYLVYIPPAGAEGDKIAYSSLG